MGQIVLVTGGARSGKSRFAESIATRSGGPVCYIATGAECDEEMADRIAHHRERRSADWTTIEVSLDLPAAVRAVPNWNTIVLVDCLAAWASSHLIALGDSEAAGWWQRVAILEESLTADLTEILKSARNGDRRLILVSNEVGYGVVPPTALGRAFRDLVGRLNQSAAARADAVYLVAAGLAVDLKRLAVDPDSLSI